MLNEASLFILIRVWLRLADEDCGDDIHVGTLGSAVGKHSNESTKSVPPVRLGLEHTHAIKE